MLDCRKRGHFYLWTTGGRRPLTPRGTVSVERCCTVLPVRPRLLQPSSFFETPSNAADLGVASVPFCLPCIASEPQAPAANDALAPLPAGSVRFAGAIGDVIQTCIARTDTRPEHPRPRSARSQCVGKTRCGRPSSWGKWFTSAALAYRYRPEPECGVDPRSCGEGLAGYADARTATSAPTSHRPSWRAGTCGDASTCCWACWRTTT